MQPDRTYRIRRAALSALKEYQGVPCEMNEIVNYPMVRADVPERHEVIEQVRNLIKWGFVQPYAESNDQYMQISGSGLDQINKEVKLDQRIWGKFALK